MTAFLLIANSISPIVTFLPGFYSQSLHVGFLLSMLAAIIERPFVGWAGVKRSPLVYSIRANTLSHLVGFLILLFLPYSFYYVFNPLVIIFCAMVISVFVEGFYLSRKTLPLGSSIRIAYIIAGNVISSMLIYGLGRMIIFLKHQVEVNCWIDYVVKLSALKFQIPLHLAALAIMLLMLFSFLLPTKRTEIEEELNEGCDPADAPSGTSEMT